MIAEAFFAEMEKIAKIRLKVPPVSSMMKLPGQGGGNSKVPKLTRSGSMQVKSAPGMGRRTTGAVGPPVRSSAYNPATTQNAITRAIGRTRAMANLGKGMQ